MDFLSKHLAPLPRLFNSETPVDSIGFLPRKTDRVVTTFDSYNFSFILEGRGEYFRRGKRYEVVAPCVLTQWPGEPMNYGPTDYWTEIYLIFSSTLGEVFRRRKFFVEERFLWQIADPAAVIELGRKLYDLPLDGDGAADRHDLLCANMIMESLLAAAPSPAGPGEADIRAIAAMIRRDCTQHYDYERLAQKCGMSLSTFRRYWLQYLGVPPARYQDDILQQDACRMLVETPLSIKEIAQALGFDDPLYFSRRFHQLTGMPPTEYRRRNCLREFSI